MQKSRFQNSILNLTSGLAYRLLTMFTAFVVRTVFVKCLSEDYLGINGLYTNILSVLSIAELGFGIAMVYSMYQPLADGNQYKLAQLQHLYKRVYRIIGTVVLGLGLMLVPFLDYLIKDAPDVEGLTLYYLLYLSDSVVSYWFFAYRNAILQADQKAYVITGMQGLFSLIKSVGQILLLLLLRNYTAYLLVQIGCTIAQNMVAATLASRKYPGAFQKVEPLPDEERKRIFSDVGALMIRRVSFVALNGTDSIITSAFVGIRWVGLISNYQLIIDAIIGVLSQFTNAISASMGNYFAKEDRQASYQLYLRVDFLGFWLYAFCSVALATLLSPFITLWLGERFVLEQSVVVWLTLRFFVSCLVNILSTTRSALGLFVQARYRPLVAAVMNIVLSIVLSGPFGVVGILMATVISYASVYLWHTMLVIHRDGFQRSVKRYYCMWIVRFALIIAIALVMAGISGIVLGDGITVWSFSVLVVLTALIPNAILMALYWRNDCFRYYLDMAKGILRRFQ